MACALMSTDHFNVNANQDLLEMEKHAMVGQQKTSSETYITSLVTVQGPLLSSLIIGIVESSRVIMIETNPCLVSVFSQT